MLEDPSPVVVDLGGLREIGEWLRREAQHLTQDPAREVHFGQYSPCGETNAARWAVLTVLDGHADRADHHRRDITAIASALNDVVTRYEAVDSASAGNLRKLGR